MTTWRWRLSEKLIEGWIFLAGLLAIVVLLGIIVLLIKEGVPIFLDTPPWEFFFGTKWYPVSEPPTFGIMPFFVATLWVTIIATAISVPISPTDPMMPMTGGKSTFLRLFNRMNDLITGVKVEGRVELDSINIYDKDIDVVELRKKVGMVFQKPNPFPMSVFENVAFGPRRHGKNNRAELADIVEKRKPPLSGRLHLSH